MKNNRGQLADVVSGAAVALLGVAGVAYCIRIRMPAMGKWFSHPGLMPGFVCGCLVPMGAYLSVSAFRNWRSNPSPELQGSPRSERLSGRIADFVRKVSGSREALSALAFTLLLAAYVLGLYWGLGFRPATFVFLLAAMLVLKAGRFITIALVAAASSLLIAFGFSYLFKIPLP